MQKQHKMTKHKILEYSLVPFRRGIELNMIAQFPLVLSIQHSVTGAL